MSKAHRRMGIGRMEALLALIVLTLFLAILGALWLRTKAGNLTLDEASRMRKVYVALSLYEEQYNTLPAPTLTAAMAYDPIQADFQSPLDPFVPSQLNEQKAKQYPADPGLQNNEYSPYRISFSYLQNFLRAGKIKVKPWPEARRDPKLGILANEWVGSVKPEEPFRALVGGRLMRVNTDGSVFVLPNRDTKELGDPNDLFINR